MRELSQEAASIVAWVASCGIVFSVVAFVAGFSFGFTEAIRWTDSGEQERDMAKARGKY